MWLLHGVARCRTRAAVPFVIVMAGRSSVPIRFRTLRPLSNSRIAKRKRVGVGANQIRSARTSFASTLGNTDSLSQLEAEVVLDRCFVRCGLEDASLAVLDVCLARFCEPELAAG
jgi:hypothetical protein